MGRPWNQLARLFFSPFISEPAGLGDGLIFIRFLTSPERVPPSPGDQGPGSEIISAPRFLAQTPSHNAVAYVEGQVH